MTTANLTPAQKELYELSRVMGLSEAASIAAVQEWAVDVPAGGYTPRAVAPGATANFNEQLAEVERLLEVAKQQLATLEAGKAYDAVAARITNRVKQSVAEYNAARGTAQSAPAGTRGTASAPIREVAPRADVGAGDVPLNETGGIVDADAEVEAILKDWRQSYRGE